MFFSTRLWNADDLLGNCGGKFFESTGTNKAQSTGEGSCTESGTWIIHDSKLLNLEEPGVEDPNLENLEVENYTSNKTDILGNPHPCRPVDPDASMARDTWMDQKKEVAAQLVSTIDTDNVKFQKEDKEDIPQYQKPLISLNLNGVKTSTNAQNAQVE